MAESLPEQIQRDMTGVFAQFCERELSEEARQALMEFIQKAVVLGIRSPKGYDLFRKYLECRFKYVAAAVNARVAPGEAVTWDDIVAAGATEVAEKREDCLALIEKRAEAEGVEPEWRICERFAAEGLTRPAAR